MDLNKLARLSHIIAVKFDVVCSASFVESIGRHLEIASFRTGTLKKENTQRQHLDKPFIRSLAKRIVNLSNEFLQLHTKTMDTARKSHLPRISWYLSFPRALQFSGHENHAATTVFICRTSVVVRCWLPHELPPPMNRLAVPAPIRMKSSYWRREKLQRGILCPKVPGDRQELEIGGRVVF
jgi:hypothetical protein